MNREERKRLRVLRYLAFAARQQHPGWFCHAKHIHDRATLLITECGDGIFLQFAENVSQKGHERC